MTYASLCSALFCRRRWDMINTPTMIPMASPTPDVIPKDSPPENRLVELEISAEAAVVVVSCNLSFSFAVRSVSQTSPS